MTGRLNDVLLSCFEGKKLTSLFEFDALLRLH